MHICHVLFRDTYDSLVSVAFLILHDRIVVSCDFGTMLTTLTLSTKCVRAGCSLCQDLTIKGSEAAAIREALSARIFNLCQCVRCRIASRPKAIHLVSSLTIKFHDVADIEKLIPPSKEKETILEYRSVRIASGQSTPNHGTLAQKLYVAPPRSLGDVNRTRCGSRSDPALVQSRYSSLLNFR